MTDQARLLRDAKLLSEGQPITQHQESLSDQLDDLLTLAIFFGLYDAADYLRGVLRGA
jgi:hypothetical protein